MASTEAEEWKNAIQTEVENLMSRGTFELVRRDSIPPHARVIGYKVVLKRKYDENQVEIQKKARICAKGCMEPKRELLTYAPVANYTTIRLVLALSVAEDLELYQVDIKSAYLIADLPADRDVYMTAEKAVEYGLIDGVLEPTKLLQLAGNGAKK